MSRETYQLLARRLETKTLFINWNRKYFFGKTHKLSDYYRQLQLHWKSPRRFLLCGNNRVGFNQTKILAKKNPPPRPTFRCPSEAGKLIQYPAGQNDRPLGEYVLINSFPETKQQKLIWELWSFRCWWLISWAKIQFLSKMTFIWSGAYSGQRVELDLDGSGIKAEEVSWSVQCVFYIFGLWAQSFRWRGCRSGAGNTKLTLATPSSRTRYHHNLVHIADVILQFQGQLRKWIVEAWIVFANPCHRSPLHCSHCLVFQC